MVSLLCLLYLVGFTLMIGQNAFPNDPNSFNLMKRKHNRMDLMSIVSKVLLLVSRTDQAHGHAGTYTGNGMHGHTNCSQNSHQLLVCLMPDLPLPLLTPTDRSGRDGGDSPVH